MSGNGSRDRDGRGKDKALMMQMSHSRHLCSSITNVVSSSEIKNVMKYMFVFEVNIPIAVSS